MAFVAERLGVSVVSVPEIQREVAPLHDARSIRRLTAIMREERPHILHTHTAKAGALARAAALVAGDARPPIIVHTFHGHVLKGYFGPGRTAFFRQVERSLARISDVLVAVSPEVRDELVEHGIAPTEKFTVIRLGIPLDERLGDETADLDYRRLYGIPEDAFVVGWVGRMTGVKDTDAVLEIVRATRERGVRRRALHGRRRARPRAARAGRARPRHRALDVLRRLPGRRRRLLPALRRVPPAVRQRGNARERDRGARVRNTGRRDARRRRAGRRDATASTASSSSRATRKPPRSGLPRSRATRSSARGSASRAARTCASATRSSASSTTSTGSTARCSPRRARSRRLVAHASRRSRRGTSRGRARAASAAGSRDRAAASGSRRTRRRARCARPRGATRARAPAPSR